MVNFSFEERQWLKFELYDWDKGEVSKAKLADQAFLGSAECLLGQIVSSPGKTFVAQLQSEATAAKKEKKEKEKGKSKSLFHFFSKKKKSKSKRSTFVSLFILIVSVGFLHVFGSDLHNLHACKLS